MDTICFIVIYLKYNKIRFFIWNKIVFNVISLYNMAKKKNTHDKTKCSKGELFGMADNNRTSEEIL